MLTIIAIGLATLAILLIVAGLIHARNQRRHVPLMLSAFAADMVSLVLVEVVIPLVEERPDPASSLFDRNEVSPIKVVHALFATASIVGYVMQILTGRKIMAGQRALIVRHKKWARYFLVTRLLAYVTMFMAT